MKYTIWLVLIFISLSTVSVNSQNLDTEIDSVSYSAGVLVGKNLKLQELDDIDLDIFIQAIRAMFNDDQTVMQPSDAEMFMRNYQTKKEEMIAERNKAAGEAFLAENAKRPEVTVTESGLQYEVITMGEGARPMSTDTVYTHYHGTLIDGTVFDSSVERGEPIEFPLNRVIAGWTEVLQLMPVGSIWRAYIPYDLAYGSRGAGSVIGPYSALIFDIELLEIR